MSVLADLPALGVGFIYWPALEGVLSQPGHGVNVLELEPQAFWFQSDRHPAGYDLDPVVFDRLAGAAQRCLVHGVGFPIGGTAGPDPAQVTAFIQSIRRLDAPWASEHLSLNRLPRDGRRVDAGFLLPPVQSPASVDLATGHIRALQRVLPVPFAFETGVNYLRPLPGELDDGEFFAAVARQADCGILLDLHNLWANERNGRQPVAEVIEQLPLERVIELHLAGGQEFGGYWVDAHSGLVAPELMDIARTVVPRLPNLKAIIFEIMPQFVLAYDITDQALVEQFRDLGRLWALRPAHGEPVGRHDPVPAPADVSGPAVPPTPGQWEAALAEVLAGAPGGSALAAALARDAGTGVIGTLISAARAGKIADTLPLTTRLLLLSLGAERVQGLLAEFWAHAPSRQMASNEARDFVAWALSGRLPHEVEQLANVTGFELAAHRAIMGGREQVIVLDADPQLLLAPLRRGELPPALPRGRFELTVTPPGRAGG